MRAGKTAVRNFMCELGPGQHTQAVNKQKFQLDQANIPKRFTK